jgi:hypothetical protein
VSVTAAAQVYNAAADFSPVANPAGPWSYGFTPTLGGAFTPFAMFHTEAGGAFQVWDVSGTRTPGVYHNGTSDPLSYLSIRMGPGALAAHPGASGEYGIVRFTAPVGGRYNLLASFEGGDIGPTSTDVHVLRNGLSLFDALVHGLGADSARSHDQALTLAAGDWIDFAVGYGNSNYSNDTTILTAQLSAVSAVPEPTSLALVGTGLAGLTTIVRRRRQRSV